MTRPGLQKLRSARYVGNDGGPMKTGLPPKIGRSMWYFRKVKCCPPDTTIPFIRDIYFNIMNGKELIIVFNERMYWRSPGDLADLFTLKDEDGTTVLLNPAGSNDILNTYITRNNVTTSSGRLTLTLSSVQINLSKTYTLRFTNTNGDFNDYGHNPLEPFDTKTANIATQFYIEDQELDDLKEHIGNQNEIAKIILYKDRNTDDIKAEFTANFDMSSNIQFLFSDHSDNLFFDISGTGSNLDISSVAFTDKTVTFDISNTPAAKRIYDLSYNINAFEFRSRNYKIDSFNGSDYEVANFISNCKYSSSNLTMAISDATFKVNLDNSAADISNVKFEIKAGGADALISKISIDPSQNIRVLTTDISISNLTDLMGITQPKLKSGDNLSVHFTHGTHGKITSHDISHGIVGTDISASVYLLDISQSIATNPIQFRVMDVSVNVADSSSIILYFDDDVSFNNGDFIDNSSNFVFDISTSSYLGTWDAKQLDISNLAASGNTITFQCRNLSGIQTKDDIRRIKSIVGWNNNIIYNDRKPAKKITANLSSYFWDSSGNPGYVWPPA